MNNNDLINFNGTEITIEDLHKEPSKKILIGLYIKTHDLESSIKSVCKKIDGINIEINNQWAKIGKNGKSIGYIKGILFVIVPIILSIIGYLALQI